MDLPEDAAENRRMWDDAAPDWVYSSLAHVCIPQDERMTSGRGTRISRPDVRLHWVAVAGVGETRLVRPPPQAAPTSSAPMTPNAAPMAATIPPAIRRGADGTDTWTVASTPGDPSAFITTAVHLPGSMSQSTMAPTPSLDWTQKSCSAGTPIPRAR